MTDTAGTVLSAGPGAIDQLLDSAVAGVPRWRRADMRRELASYVEDAVADLAADGVPPDKALSELRERFGDPDLIAEGFRTLPPSRWARGARSASGPLGMVILGLVLGLALVQARTPGRAGVTLMAEAANKAAPAQLPDRPDMALLHVREVESARPADVATGAGDLRVASRLGLPANDQRVLEPSVPAMVPAWLPDGYDPATGAPFLTASATVQFFPHNAPDRPGIVIETLRPDRSTVFQVKERHVSPVRVGSFPGFYIDGEWQVRGPADEQSAPPAWRTDRSHSLLFARDGLLVLVAGPAELDMDSLLRIARSLK